jgi:LEA14-like dessication related protein
LENSNSLASRRKATLDVPLSVTYAGLYNTFSSLLDTKEAAYNLALKLSFPTPLLENKVFPLDFSGVLPILQIPEISFQGISQKSLSLTAMEFVLNWEVNNKNNLAFDIGEFLYDFRVNNSLWAQGRMDDPPRLNANGRTVIPLTVSLNALSVVRELTDVIARGAAVNYSSTGSMSLAGDLPGLDKLELPVNLGGSTRIRQ